MPNAAANAAPKNPMILADFGQPRVGAWYEAGTLPDPLGQLPTARPETVAAGCYSRGHRSSLSSY